MIIKSAVLHKQTSEIKMCDTFYQLHSQLELCRAHTPCTRCACICINLMLLTTYTYIYYPSCAHEQKAHGLHIHAV